jgi:hypothetical protein
MFYFGSMARRMGIFLGIMDQSKMPITKAKKKNNNNNNKLIGSTHN